MDSEYREQDEKEEAVRRVYHVLRKGGAVIDPLGPYP